MSVAEGGHVEYRFLGARPGEPGSSRLLLLLVTTGDSVIRLERVRLFAVEGVFVYILSWCFSRSRHANTRFLIVA